MCSECNAKPDFWEKFERDSGGRGLDCLSPQRRPVPDAVPQLCKNTLPAGDTGSPLNSAHSLGAGGHGHRSSGGDSGRGAVALMDGAAEAVNLSQSAVIAAVMDRLTTPVAPVPKVPGHPGTRKRS
ncbi:hypothetical protein AAFF_G00012630 [Aldrovandia affinis]|uniref:Uncharacterized protein n=1 Tax=Aldrovandia affinis TaxID=143900 RepID=A0AAD7S6K2_9TELE|nr:hypothetical protein AAFF_G00012630 [Aldrovandia affinis]